MSASRQPGRGRRTGSGPARVGSGSERYPEWTTSSKQYRLLGSPGVRRDSAASGSGRGWVGRGRPDRRVVKPRHGTISSPRSSLRPLESVRQTPGGNRQLGSSRSARSRNGSRARAPTCCKIDRASSPGRESNARAHGSRRARRRPSSGPPGRRHRLRRRGRTARHTAATPAARYPLREDRARSSQPSGSSRSWRRMLRGWRAHRSRLRDDQHGTTGGFRAGQQFEPERNQPIARRPPGMTAWANRCSR